MLNYPTLALNEEPAVSSLTKGIAYVSVTLEGVWECVRAINQVREGHRISSSRLNTNIAIMSLQV